MDGREHVRRGGLRRAVKETTRYVDLYGVIFSGLSDSSGCFAGFIDFRADLRQGLRMDMNMTKTAKNAGGRPRGSRRKNVQDSRLAAIRGNRRPLFVFNTRRDCYKV